MSVKSTRELTRKQAIEIIVEKEIKPVREEIERTLQRLTNKYLEELLDNRYYESEFENYIVKGEN